MQPTFDGTQPVDYIAISVFANHMRLCVGTGDTLTWNVWCGAFLASFQKHSLQYMKISLDKRVGFPGNTSNFSTKQLLIKPYVTSAGSVIFRMFLFLIFSGVCMDYS
jgi:hypothetical protein